jgi:2,4-dienoyl-CoA reductase-like NADH-dependent reductase (Old Yellow Enzyme family)
MSVLFSPLTIKGITFRNRIAVSPMCQYSCENGFANDWHLVHLGSRAVGGAGLIIQEATAVSPEGRITPGDLGLWNDKQAEKLSLITAFISSHGTVPGIQLAHAGRKAGCALPKNGGKQLEISDGGWQTLAPSAIPFLPSDNPPKELDIKGIEKIKADFRSAAKRALDAGFKLIDLHSAHGYLLHEFLSPLTNLRKDNYGGNFENRIRLLLEIVGEIQSVWPENYPLIVRLSATDWAEKGWDIDEVVKLAAILKQKGVDLIDTSSGGLLPDVKIPFGPGYQVPFAGRIRKEAGIMTGAVGMITDALQAEEILNKGQADLILIGRESLRDPYFPLKAAKALGDDISWPLQYTRAK